ncbi:MAG: Anthranilate phosphoribosyltransferase, partial [Labilithrix sp.]|nr:Anthranilate phosphoribosyltransferase [Labilithrix sp.]
MPDAGADHASFGDIFALLERRALGPDAVRAAFVAILDGAWTAVQIGAFASSLRLQGETAEIIVAAAEALRGVMTAVDTGLDLVVDTCGTGGDGAHTLNVSTAAAIVVAAAGLPVAKHGNRSVSSRCGSADVIEALGIPVDVAPGRQRDVLHEAGIAFLMAPVHHPALRHAAQARRELGLRTIFNALGPLVNPARATHQLVGVYDDALRPVMASALGRLGVTRAWLVRSEDGLDEISPAAATRVSVLEDGVVREEMLEPESFGVPRGPLTALRGGDATENAAAIEALFEGGSHPARVAVIVNAAAAIAIARGTGLREAAEEAAARAIAAREKAEQAATTLAEAAARSHSDRLAAEQAALEHV